MENIDRLRSQLVTSGLQQRDPALFHVINELIRMSRGLQTSVNNVSFVLTEDMLLSLGYWSVLTDGDTLEMDLITANGEAIMVWNPL